MDKLNILHVAYSLGESSAATRIAKSLDDKVNNYFLCGRISKNDYIRKNQLIKNISFFGSLFTRLVDRMLFKALNHNDGELFSYGIISFPQRFFTWLLIKFYKIDVLHYHWGGFGFFPLASIPNVKKLKVVITLHDYHVVTGGCHIPMESEINDCSRFLKWKGIGSWLLKKNFSKNLSIIKTRNITLISPSSFVQKKIKKFFNSNIIHNCYEDKYFMDEEKFNSIKDDFRKTEEKKSTIIVVGLKKSRENNKGFDTFEKVFKKISINAEVIGVSCSKSNFISKTFGTIDSLRIRELYFLADLCIVFSRSETFSQVCLESLMCGTPVIAYGSNGPGDILQKSRQGLQLNHYSPEEFKTQIEKNLSLKKKEFISYKELSSFRKFFDPEEISHEYLKEYKRQ